MQTIVVDECRWKLEFEGFTARLRAHTDLISISLRPWTCAWHFNALREHLRLGAAGLELDTEGYADSVLKLATMQTTNQAHDPEGRLAQGQAQRARRLLALWWASGVEPGERGEVADARPDHEGWLGLGEGRAVQLRSWTFGERLAAQRRHLHGSGSERDFDVVAYLETMVQTCVLGLNAERGPPPRLDDLDARATRCLLAAVTALNHPDGQLDPLADISPELAAATVRLCAAMGWTPERVLATPAVEVQRLLALLDKLGGEGAGQRQRAAGSWLSRSTTPRRRGLADHPDAVVLVFGDEGARA